MAQLDDVADWPYRCLRRALIAEGAFGGRAGSGVELGGVSGCRVYEPVDAPGCDADRGVYDCRGAQLYPALCP